MRTAASVFLALALAFAFTSRNAAAESASSCIRFWGEARYGALGYNHVVHLANACSADAECVVSTNVNPDAQTVTVAGRSEVLVNTFLGSPARTFTPRVKCTMQ